MMVWGSTRQGARAEHHAHGLNQDQADAPGGQQGLQGSAVEVANHGTLEHQPDQREADLVLKDPVKQIGRDCYHSNEIFPTRHRKGGDMAEWPETIRVREFPRSAGGGCADRPSSRGASAAARSRGTRGRRRGAPAPG